MKHQFTPGPYHPQIENHDGANVLIIRNEVGVEIAAICPQKDVGETEANARLLSLSADMAEVLGRIVKWDAARPTYFAALDASQTEWKKIINDTIVILLRIMELKK